MRALWILALGLVAAPVSAADQQFDLVCTAKRDVTRYRIDLARNEWCQEACARTFKIDSATSSQLVLENKQPKFRGDALSIVQIDRSTGDWLEVRSFARGAIVRNKGTCEPAQFTGFPSPKF